MDVQRTMLLTIKWWVNSGMAHIVLNWIEVTNTIVWNHLLNSAWRWQRDKILVCREKSSNFTDGPVFDLLVVETPNSKSSHKAISCKDHLSQWYILLPKITQMVCALLFLLWFGIGRFHPYSSRLLRWPWNNHTLGANEAPLSSIGKYDNHMNP